MMVKRIEKGIGRVIEIAAELAVNDGGYVVYSPGIDEFYGQASGVADGEDIILYHQPATPGMTAEDAEEELWQHSKSILAKCLDATLI